MPSNFLKLNSGDYIKSCAIFVLTAVFGFLYQVLQDKGVNFSSADLLEAGRVAFLAVLGYLSKNLLTNSQGQILKADK